ncbi:hypothetical protein TEA_026215 [Camellia sinensis var. sinensis]|uniref:Beta-galactosidase n=1 Tax=Camellia sinensis var. sinensis TaxID=542762 RepID=A0A4S4EM13_CAMSN|nr:hypothetical protein TEA_026215 [Camellia sinensis var. sinensis]
MAYGQAEGSGLLPRKLNPGILFPPIVSRFLESRMVVPLDIHQVKTEHNERMTTSIELFDSAERWEEFEDVIPNFSDTSIKSNTLLEHMNMTKDESDYLWYTFRFQQNSTCTKPLLHIESLGHVVHVFANKMYFGTAHGSHDVKGLTFENSILLNNDISNISVLSVMVGLPDSGPFLEKRFAGLTSVEIRCSEEVYNFTDHECGYQVGLLGEKLHIYDEQNLSNVDWSKTRISTNQPLTCLGTGASSRYENETFLPVRIGLNCKDND